MRLRIRSAAAIWYGRMTSNNSSTVKMQYFVSTDRSVCLDMNVFANAIRSMIGLLLASAHHDVNSKELEVFFLFRRGLVLPATSFT